MMGHGVIVRPADGGFIVSWTELRGEEPPNYDRPEPDYVRRVRSPYVRREAVRTSVETTLALVSEILKGGRLAMPGEGEAYEVIA